MPLIQRTILIDVPIEEVFSFVADCSNAAKFQRQFSRFEAVGEPTEGLGLTVDARGSVNGIPVRALLRVTEFVQNERIVSKSVAGLKSHAEWNLRREGGQTRVDFLANYAWPLPIPSGLLRRKLESQLAAITEASLLELRRLLEEEQGRGRHSRRVSNSLPAD